MMHLMQGPHTSLARATRRSGLTCHKLSRCVVGSTQLDASVDGLDFLRGRYQRNVHASQTCASEGVLVLPWRESPTQKRKHSYRA